MTANRNPLRALAAAAALAWTGGSAHAATPAPYCATCAETGLASHAQAPLGGSSTTSRGAEQAQDPGQGGSATASSAASATSPAVVAGVAFGGGGGASAPTSLAGVYVRRAGPACTDFTRLPEAGWSATTAIQFPGPWGPVRLDLGQTVHPGDYVQGMDLGSVLQRDCSQRPSL